MQRNALLGGPVGFNPSSLPHPFTNQAQAFSSMSNIAPPPYPGQKPPPPMLSSMKQPSLTEKSIFDLSPEKPARQPSFPDPSTITSLPGPPNLSGHTSLPGPPNLMGHSSSLPGPPSLPAPPPPSYPDMNPPLPPPKHDPPPPAYPKQGGGFSQQLPVTEQDLVRAGRSMGIGPAQASADNFGLIKPSPLIPSAQSYNQLAGGGGAAATSETSIDSLFGFNTSSADNKHESDLQKSLFDPEYPVDYELPKSEEVSDFSDLFDTSSIGRMNKKEKVGQGRRKVIILGSAQHNAPPPRQLWSKVPLFVGGNIFA